MSEFPEVVKTDHSFEIRIGADTAFAEYSEKDGVLTLPHTVVPEAFAGKGVGGLLAKAALGYARANALKVRPTCSFMAGYITKHPDQHDLVEPAFRAELGI